MKTIDKKPERGDLVRHKITGFKGIVLCVTTWLNGCERLSVQPEKTTKEGAPPEAHVFDIQELEVLEAAKLKPAPIPAWGATKQAVAVRAQPGGDRPNYATRPSAPRRR